MKNCSRRRCHPLLIYSGLAVAVVVASGFYVARWRQLRFANNDALSAVANSIALGESDQSALQTCERISQDRPGWTFHSWPDANPLPIARLSTPMVFGASNWVVYVVFQHNRVGGVFVRSFDTKKIWPSGAPIDRVTEDVRAICQKEFTYASD